MNRSKFFIAALTLLCTIVVQAVDATHVAAELLSAEELASCQLHVVGIYSPQDSNTDDRMFVSVQPTGKPIVLVLTGYNGAQWNLQIDPKADVRQVIVAGYFEHSVLGVPDTIPTEMITYFPAADKSNREYFWAYSWHTKNGRELRTRLKEITGLEISTFQGEYSAKQFTVDGKRGLVGGLTSSDQPKTQPPKRTSPGENQLREQGLAAKLKLLELSDRFGANHPVLKQLEKSIEIIGAELRRIGAKPIGPATTQPSIQQKPAVESDPRQVIEALVRQTFQLQTELQVARMEKAEEDLKRVKAQLQQRQDSAEKIIAARVDELINSGLAKPNTDDDTPASLLASEGWEAWRARNLRTALDKFRSAVAKDPGNETALNGLGWTLTNLGEYENAIVEFKKILKSTPTHAAALNGVGQCLLGLGKLDEAESELLKATEDAISEHGEAEAARIGLAAWYGLVRTYLQKKDYPQAKRWSERFLKHKPEDEIMKAMHEQAESKKETSD